MGYDSHGNGRFSSHHERSKVADNRLKKEAEYEEKDAVLKKRRCQRKDGYINYALC